MDHELAKYWNWPYIAKIIEFQKKIDDVIEWRHFVQILSKFRRMFLLSRCLIYVYRNSIRSGRGVIHTMAILRHPTTKLLAKLTDFASKFIIWGFKSPPSPSFNVVWQFFCPSCTLECINQHWKWGRGGSSCWRGYLVFKDGYLFHERKGPLKTFCQVLLSLGVWISIFPEKSPNSFLTGFFHW